MFQIRTEPRYLKVKRLIDEGELGEIVRVNWLMRMDNGKGNHSLKVIATFVGEMGAM